MHIRLEEEQSASPYRQWESHSSACAYAKQTRCGTGEKTDTVGCRLISTCGLTFRTRGRRNGTISVPARDTDEIGISALKHCAGEIPFLQASPCHRQLQRSAGVPNEKMEYEGVELGCDGRVRGLYLVVSTK